MDIPQHNYWRKDSHQNGISTQLSRVSDGCHADFSSSLPSNLQGKKEDNFLLLSPGSQRRRNRKISQRTTEILQGSSHSRLVLHVARDPIQPLSGSISDVRRGDSVDAEDDAEESDVFSVRGSFRSRSNTCPETRAYLRKVRVRNRNRPLTPPPGGVDDCEMQRHLSKMAARGKYHISGHAVPNCIPESTVQNDSNMSLDNCDINVRFEQLFCGDSTREHSETDGEEGMFKMDE